ncbi:hypothetical protein BH09PSE2_BH09PSE2_18900 [soil metagenome]
MKTAIATAEAVEPSRPVRRAAAPTAPGAGSGSWFADFIFARGRIKVRQTGADLPLDQALIGEALIWSGYHLIVRARSWWMALRRPRALRIWFAPHTPRPWYMIWSAMAWGGVRIARSPEEADAVFAFEDTTWRAPVTPPRLPAFNIRCADISKSRVAEVFERVFGYPLAVDPQTWSGPAVCKGEANGVHDGCVVMCPTAPVEGSHHQRLIDTREGEFTFDLRTACIGGAPVVVWKKRKAAADGFSIHNLSVTSHDPAAVFSPAELERIGAFLQAMHLDWAGLDILRDRHSGLIYVVDVNTTDVGPIIALSLADKLRSTALLSAALQRMLQRGR